MTPPTPATTAQEALATLRKGFCDDSGGGCHPAVCACSTAADAADALETALSDAERRATEAEGQQPPADWRELYLWAKGQLAKAQSRLSAVEARCGLMEKLVRAVGGSATKNHVPKDWFAERDSILADPGSKP